MLNSVTRQVNFNRTKIGEKFPKLKCDILSDFQAVFSNSRTGESTVGQNVEKSFHFLVMHFGSHFGPMCTEKCFLF